MKPIIVIGLAAAALVAVGILAAENLEGLSVKKPYDHSDNKGPGGGGTPTIIYHQGAVMTGAPVNVYVIYYGDYGASPADAAAQGIIDTFFTDLSVSGRKYTSYYTVNDTYTDSTNTTVAPLRAYRWAASARPRRSPRWCFFSARSAQAS